jgi:hypothetical protein
VVAGLGDHGLRCGDAEVVFSAEDVGWLLSIDGRFGEDEAWRFVATVAAQVEHEVSEPVEWLQIT